jgi:hypothetical protein
MSEPAPPSAGTELPPEVIDKVRAAHGGLELKLLTAEDGTQVIAKAPNRGEWKRYRSMINDPAQRASAYEALFFGCVVYPTGGQLTALIEGRPGYCETFGERLAAWSGAGQEVTEKKL